MPEEYKLRLSGTPEQIAEMLPQIITIYQLLESKDVGTIYATENKLEGVNRRSKPKITLVFLEDTTRRRTGGRPGVAEGQRRQEGVISFRLMNETTDSFSKANATSIGRKIKEIFGADTGYVWDKGKTMYSYSDWELGYQLQLLCKSESEAKRIVSSVLSIQRHAPNWTNFNTIKNDEEIAKYPEEPGSHIVMGETVPKFKRRPLVDVRFQYAYARLGGVIKPVTLYDRTGKRVGALVRQW